MRDWTKKEKKIKEREENNKEKGENWRKKEKEQNFPGGAVVESLPANAVDTGSSPGPGGSHMPQSN